MEGPMKRSTVWIPVFLIMSFTFSCFISGNEDADLQTIRKAVRKNSGYKKGMRANQFKLLIVDRNSHEEKILVTLPLSLVDLLFHCVEDKEMDIDCGNYDLDLRSLYKELKKAGPASLIEIKGEDAIVKVWLE